MDQVSEVEVSTTPLASAAEILAVNPTGKIPALLRPDAPGIYDSRVISRFLDAYADTGFYPASRLWEVLTLEATADAIMDATVGMTYEIRLRPEAQQSPDWLSAQWGKADRAIRAINDRWMSHLSGPIDMAQIATACALSYVDLRHNARGWRDSCPDLAAWHATFNARDSMGETAVEPS